jgi:AmmeMemoRadiSam system protein B
MFSCQAAESGFWNDEEQSLRRRDVYATILFAVADQTQSLDIRPSSIAGSWYPGDAESLAISIDQFLNAVKPKDIEGQVMGLIVPHAGHRYSGGVAAHAFSQIRGYRPDAVIVIAPLHMHADEPVLTSGHQAYETPLGISMIDHDLLANFEAELRQEYGLKLGRLRNDREHSLEIELPFIQRCIETSYTLLPIMLRDQSPRAGKAVGKVLGSLLQGRDCIIIGSSDLSHFYPQAVAERLDRTILDRLERFDPEGVIQAEEEGLGYACGRGAIAAVLWATRDLGANRVEVVKQATSGDVTGDLKSVVGYGSAVIYRQN